MAHGRVSFWTIKPLIWGLFFCGTAAAKQDPWRPDPSNHKDGVKVVVSMEDQHKGFTQSHASHSRNPVYMVQQAAKIIEELGDAAADISFGKVSTISYSYTNEGELLYDENALATLKADILASLDHVQGELSGHRIGKFNDDLLKIVNNKPGLKLTHYYKLAPFIYNETGTGLIERLGKDQLSSLRTLIEGLTMNELEAKYSDVFKNHLAPFIKNTGNEVLVSNLNKFNSSFMSGSTYQKAKTPVGAITGLAVKKIDVVLEEMPPLAAIFRSSFGDDCSSSTIPYYSLHKSVKVFLVNKKGHSQPVGYVFVANVKYGRKFLPYIITINGSTLTGIDATEAVYAVAGFYNTQSVLISSDNSLIINTYEIADALNKMPNRKDVVITEPEGWSSCLDNDQDNGYYSFKGLGNAVLIKLDRKQEINIKVVPTRYREANMVSRPLAEKAPMIRNLINYGEKLDNMILDGFELTEEEKMAFKIYDGNNQPSARDFMTAREVLGFGLKDILTLNMALIPGLIGELYASNKDIATKQEWDRLIDDFYGKLKELLEEESSAGSSDGIYIEEPLGLKDMLKLPEEYGRERFLDFILSMDGEDIDCYLTYDFRTRSSKEWAQWLIKDPKIFEVLGSFLGHMGNAGVEQFIAASSEIPWSQELGEFVINAIAESLYFAKYNSRTNNKALAWAGDVFLDYIEDDYDRSIRKEFWAALSDQEDEIKGSMLNANAPISNRDRLLHDWIIQAGDKIIAPVSSEPVYQVKIEAQDTFSFIKKLEALYKELGKAKTAKDIAEVSIKLRDISANSDYEKSKIDEFEKTIEKAAKIISFNEMVDAGIDYVGLDEQNARSLLCAYAGVPAEGYPDDFLIRKALQKLHNELESNGGSFSGEGLRLITRAAVLDFFETSSEDPSVAVFARTSRTVLGVKGSSYSNYRYYIDPKFEEVRNSLKEIRGIARK